MSDALAGTAVLVRFALRRSRMALVWWVLGITSLYPVQALALEATYPTQADLDQLAASLSGNAAIIAIAGPEYALDTIGGQTAWQTSAFGAVLAGLMSTFLIVRQTRAGEENGADELVRAGAVGRAAPSAAAVTVATAANLTLIAAIALLLIASGLPAEGSWALGCACGLTGMVFMGLALIFAQVSSTSRGAWGLSGAAIGVAYALRAVGDVGDNAATWLSPIGWGQQMRAFADERWWPALLLLGATFVSIAVAHVLHDRRDFGAGLVAPRRGPASKGWRGGAYELAWRLQRPAVIGWLVGLAFGGAAYGTIGDDVGDLVGDSDLSGSLTGGETSGRAMIDGFYGSATLMLAIITAAFGVALMLRARAEETAGRTEPVLATALHRRTYLASHVAVAVIASTVGVVFAGAATGWMYGVVSGSYDRVGQLAWSALTYAPAIWVMIGLTVLLVGFVPRLASLGWLGIGFAAVVMFFGPLLKFPDWITDLSPFSHLALVPLDDVAWTPILWLTLVAAVLMTAGFVGFRRRDVQN